MATKPPTRWFCFKYMIDQLDTRLTMPCSQNRPPIHLVDHDGKPHAGVLPCHKPTIPQSSPFFVGKIYGGILRNGYAPFSSMTFFPWKSTIQLYPTGSMYAIYGNIYHQYTPNVSIYTIHGSYGYWASRMTSWEISMNVYHSSIGKNDIKSPVISPGCTT